MYFCQDDLIETLNIEVVQQGVNLNQILKNY